MRKLAGIPASCGGLTEKQVLARRSNWIGYGAHDVLPGDRQTTYGGIPVFARACIIRDMHADLQTGSTA